MSWTDFFAQELFLPQDFDHVHIIHHVYLTPPTNSGPLFVLHHGAGSSGLSFATCAEEIRKILPKAGVLSIDARGHGRTTMVSPKTQNLNQDNPSTGTAAEIEADGQVELDLSLETLSQDLVYVIRQTQTRMGWDNLPDIVLVGHSLGGAVITDVAKNGELGQKLLAYAVLDVVEGGNFPHCLIPSGLTSNQVRPWMLFKAWRSIFQLDPHDFHRSRRELSGSTCALSLSPGLPYSSMFIVLDLARFETTPQPVHQFLLCCMKKASQPIPLAPGCGVPTSQQRSHFGRTGSSG